MAFCCSRLSSGACVVILTLMVSVQQIVSQGAAPLQQPFRHREGAAAPVGGRLDVESSNLDTLSSSPIAADATGGVVLPSPPTRAPQKRMRGADGSDFQKAKKRHLAKSVKEALLALERLDEDTKLHLLRQPKGVQSSHLGDDHLPTTPQQNDDLSAALHQAREDASCLSARISSADTNDEKDPLPEDIFAQSEEESRLEAMKAWKLEILKVRQERINDTRSRAFQLFGAFSAQKTVTV